MIEGNEIHTINESEFKRLCGEVWADSLSGFDQTPRGGAGFEQEKLLLDRVLFLTRDRLELNSEPSTLGGDVRARRSEIDALMKRYSAAEFDHNKILDRLLRELLAKQVA